MIVLLHVLIAISSITFTTYLYFKPSKGKFYGAYGLIGATLVSGTWLVISTGSPLLSSCMTGLIYFGITISGIVAAKHKLVATFDKSS